MASLRQAGSYAFCCAISYARVLFAASRRFSGSAIEAESESEGAPVPAWKYWQMKYWKLKAEAEEAKAKTEIKYWQGRCDSSAKEYFIFIQDARLEILQYKYQLKARGILELFIMSLKREALLHCKKKEEDEHLPKEERKFYKRMALNWFPQVRKEIWHIIFEMSIMIGFKEDMQKLLSSQDLDLLVMKATVFHKELFHFHHSGVRQRENITFVRQHIGQGIHDHSVDPMHLEGFMQAMAKKINVNLLFVDEREVSESADE